MSIGILFEFHLLTLTICSRSLKLIFRRSTPKRVRIDYSQFRNENRKIWIEIYNTTSRYLKNNNHMRTEIDNLFTLTSKYELRATKAFIENTDRRRIIARDYFGEIIWIIFMNPTYITRGLHTGKFDPSWYKNSVGIIKFF